ncbi:hypothetical protein RIF29_39507 [Crotalaria pallida]|uniref:RNA binding protein n=1 Tax=Crotalaria pallida TaxID=3830 RepID=A0AAN9HQS4_CROPI
MDSRKTNNPYSDNGASPEFASLLPLFFPLSSPFSPQQNLHRRVTQRHHLGYVREVEIKRTIPKGSSQSNDFKTKKIFIGGIPTTVSVVLEI